ncbi:MAG: B12-binding domain-containing radical SAM protein [Thermoleophilia bacterium]|nr:B12-binding domain-containing radical SAM protein [Thermoleophilia bacterium]
MKTGIKTKPKVVLFFPSPLEGRDYTFEMPLSTLAVAAPLHADRYRVIMIDERLHDDAEKQLLDAADGALCVGVSTMTGFQLGRAIHFSRLVKERRPGVPVIWGGYHPSLLPDQTAIQPYVDAVVRGQGERTFQEVVQRLEEGRWLEDVAGVTFRSNGSVTANPGRRLAELDSFPRLPYELLDVERFFFLNGGRRNLQYVSSQGCPFKCAFCVEPSVFGRWKCRSAGTVVADLKELHELFQPRHITFADPNFFVSRGRVREFCELMKQELPGLTWSAAARTDQIEEMGADMPHTLFESGCRQLTVGIESGSQEILDLIDKRTSLANAVKTNEVLKDSGIRGCYAFMVGFPKSLPEAANEIKETLTLVKKMRRAHRDIITAIMYLTPYPGTGIFNLAMKLNVKVPETIDKWAGWDSTSVNTTWINGREKDLVERCNNLYFPFAYPNEQLRRRMNQLKFKPFLYPLHALAALRCRFDYYGMPFEWWLVRLLSRRLRFERAFSQLGALRRLRKWQGSPGGDGTAYSVRSRERRTAA